MSRLHPEKKNCENCNNTFLAKRSDAQCCSNSCRARLSELGKSHGTVIRAVKNQGKAEDTPAIAKGTTSLLIDPTEPLLEMECCSKCYYSFEKKDLYHHKSRAWFSDLYFCQKCLTCCSLDKEYTAISFEEIMVTRWNRDNKHNHEVLQILWKKMV